MHVSQQGAAKLQLQVLHQLIRLLANVAVPGALSRLFGVYLYVREKKHARPGIYGAAIRLSDY